MKKYFKPIVALAAAFFLVGNAYSQVEFKETIVDDEGLVKEIVVSGKRDYSIVLAKDYSYMAKTAENRLIPMEIENQSMVGRFTRRFDGITLIFPGENGLWGLKSVVNDSVLLEPRFRIILNHFKDHVNAYGVKETENEFYEWTGDSLNPLKRIDTSKQSAPMTEFTISQEILKSGNYSGTANYEIAVGAPMADMRNKRMVDDKKKALKARLDFVQFGYEKRKDKEVMKLQDREVLVATEWEDYQTEEQWLDRYWLVVAYDTQKDGSRKWRLNAVDMESAELVKVNNEVYTEVRMDTYYKGAFQLFDKEGDWLGYFRFDGKTEPRLVPQKYEGGNWIHAE